MIALLAIILAAATGYAVFCTYYQPRTLRAKIAALQASHQAAREAHKPSKHIHRQLVKAKAEQIRSEV